MIENVVGGTLLYIKYKEINENGEIFIEQEATRPTVYLDNWVIDLFSFENKELGDNFLSIMKEVNGTIAFSIINLFEITHRTDKDQVHRIMNYLESFNGVFI